LSKCQSIIGHNLRHWEARPQRALQPESRVEPDKRLAQPVFENYVN
jgi:hypothetical protein